MAPEALREDTDLLDCGRVVEIPHRRERPDPEPPRPTRQRGIVLRLTDDLDDREDGLPDGRVQDRPIPRLHRRALRRRVRANRRDVDLRSQRPVAAATDQQPVAQRLGGFGGTGLVVGVRWTSRGKDA
jgi:hypothetical protein